MCSSRFPVFALVHVLTVLSLPAAVVTTVDNNSGDGDGVFSLLEALTNVQENETISFNIPGEGPHYIQTPESGYPLIESAGVVIDGYSQPGSVPNTAGPDQPRNTRLKIVLDSRTDEPNTRRTVLDFPGFGLSESCVIGLQDAAGVSIRGLSFIGVAGAGNDDDAHVYCIALAGESSGAKIQGCWFGLDPARENWKPGADGIVPGVFGSRSAVASFKWEGRSSEGLIFGVDGDGTGDSAEGNVAVAQRLAVHLETPNAVLAGNWINFFPDGSLLNPEKQALELEDGTMEIAENGDGTNMRIGTNGDGTSDLEEGNRFGPFIYDACVEFWRVSPGVVFAGNTVGFSLDRMPIFSSPDSHLTTMRSGSSIRIGTDGNGRSDALEANYIYGIGRSLIRMNGQVAVGFRGNVLTGNTGEVPLDGGAGVTPEIHFSEALEDSFSPMVMLDGATSQTVLIGNVPLQREGNDPPMLDLYLADPFALYEGFTQGRKWLGTFAVDQPGDQDAGPGGFRFDISSLALQVADVPLLTAAATYETASGSMVTTNFSTALQSLPRPSILGGVDLQRSGEDLILSWSGGTGPFRIYSTSDPAEAGSPMATVNGQSATFPPGAGTRPREFYYIREGALP